VYEVVFNFNWYRSDADRNPHPSPAEHLLYLDKICPEFDLSPETRVWVTEMQSNMLRDYPHPQGLPFPGNKENRVTFKYLVDAHIRL
jgi:hypothetical protein